MDSPSAPDSALPLGVLAKLATGEAQTRELLQQCANAVGFLGFLLDIDEVTKIMRACARETFQIRVEYWRMQPGELCHRSIAIAEETIRQTLRLAPPAFALTKYKEAIPGIRTALQADLATAIQRLSETAEPIMDDGHRSPETTDSFAGGDPDTKPTRETAAGTPIGDRKMAAASAAGKAPRPTLPPAAHACIQNDEDAAMERLQGALAPHLPGHPQFVFHPAQIDAATWKVFDHLIAYGKAILDAQAKQFSLYHRDRVVDSDLLESQVAPEIIGKTNLEWTRWDLAVSGAVIEKFGPTFQWERFRDASRTGRNRPFEDFQTRLRDAIRDRIAHWKSLSSVLASLKTSEGDVNSQATGTRAAELVEKNSPDATDASPGRPALPSSSVLAIEEAERNALDQLKKAIAPYQPNNPQFDCQPAEVNAGCWKLIEHLMTFAAAVFDASAREYHKYHPHLVREGDWLATEIGTEVVRRTKLQWTRWETAVDLAMQNRWPAQYYDAYARDGNQPDSEDQKLLAHFIRRLNDTVSERVRIWKDGGEDASSSTRSEATHADCRSSHDRLGTFSGESVDACSTKPQPEGKPEEPVESGGLDDGPIAITAQTSEVGFHQPEPCTNPGQRVDPPSEPTSVPYRTSGDVINSNTRRGRPRAELTDRIKSEWERQGRPSVTAAICDKIAKELFGDELNGHEPGTPIHKRVRERVRGALQRNPKSPAT
jgi:hypothetical protein